MNGKELRIVFMGTPDFAVASLKALVEGGYKVVGVITAVDKPAGRGNQVAESAVKKYALDKGLYLMQPEKLKNPDFIDDLRSLQADLQVVVAFRMLPEIVWNMPPLGTFNLHGSLLPQYRGAAPLNWAVINGETKTGVTTFLLDHEIDTGKVIFMEETEIRENDTVGDIHDRLMDIGAGLVVKTVDAIASGNYTPIPQEQLANSKPIKHAPKIFKEDCRVNWEKEAETVRNLIRGLSPYPAAWSELVNIEDNLAIQTKIFFAEKTDYISSANPGAIKSDGKKQLLVACRNGWLSITDIQIAGKKRMKTDEFLCGFQQISKYKFV